MNEVGNNLQEILIVIIVIIGFVGYFYLRSPSVKGQIGEFRVDTRLRSKLDKNRYIIFTDLTLPFHGGTTQIDHIVVSIYGIFVIETKNMKGWIFGGAKQPRWTVVLHRHKSQFQNPLRQNYKHIKVIQELLGLKICQLHNVVAFVGSAEPKTDMPENILWSVRELVDYIKYEQDEIFTKNEINSFSDRLVNNSLEAGRQTRLIHIENIKIQVAERKNNAIICPRCSAKMVERSNRKSGQKFFGCSRYPNCKGTGKYS